ANYPELSGRIGPGKLTERNLEGNRIRGRIERLRIRILGLRGDAILVAHLPNIAYLCGFTGSNGMLLVESERATLFTDGRYAIQAPQEVAGTEIGRASCRERV